MQQIIDEENPIEGINFIYRNALNLLEETLNNAEKNIKMQKFDRSLYWLKIAEYAKAKIITVEEIIGHERVQEYEKRKTLACSKFGELFDIIMDKLKGDHHGKRRDEKTC